MKNTFKAMKPFSRVLIVAIVAIVALVTGIAASDSAVTAHSIKKDLLLSQTEAVQPLAVSVALPTLAEVSLQGGESESGQLISLDTVGQKLLLQRNGQLHSIALKQVEKVVFRDQSTVYRQKGKPIIRGEGDRPVGQPVSWNGLAMNTFKITDPNRGLAVVHLESVVSPEHLRGIESVAKDRQYVVNQIQFDLQHNTMSIRATPY